jgi:site-specific DNA-cytosine methylase
MFYGAGGSSSGAQKASVQIVSGMDIWNSAIKVFKTNFPKAKLFLTCIRELNPAKLEIRYWEY